MDDRFSHPPAAGSAAARRFDRTAFPRILERACSARMNGELRFDRGIERVSVSLRDGGVCWVETDSPHGRLGAYLRRTGRISLEVFNRLNRVRRGGARREAEALAESGELTPVEVRELLTVHQREVLLECFGWPEGEFTFEERGAEATTPGDVLLSIPRVILDGIAAHFTGPELERLMGLADRDRRPVPRQSAHAAESLELGDAEKRVVAVLRQGADISDLITAAQDRDAVLRLVYGLVCLGMVELAEPEGRAAIPPAPGLVSEQPQAAAGSDRPSIPAGRTSRHSITARRSVRPFIPAGRPSRSPTLPPARTSRSPSLPPGRPSRVPTVPPERSRASAIGRQSQAPGSRGTVPPRASVPPAALENVPELDPRTPGDVLESFHQGIGLLDSGEYVLATKAFRSAADRAPNEPILSSFLGWSMFRESPSDNEGMARILLRKAIDMRPDLAHAHYLLGRFLQELGDRVGAEACYEAAVQHDPEHRDAKRRRHSL